MKPYYDNGTCVIYHGDCREVLPSLEIADLLLTDPPYGVGWSSGNRPNRPMPKIIGDDGSLDVISILGLACKKLRHHRHAYIFGRWDLSDTPLTAKVELIWNKGHVGLGQSMPWGLSHEFITFAVYEWSRQNAAKGSGHLAARLRKGSVLSYPRINGSAVVRHPTEKPVELLRELIESSSCFGEVILDPFMGSGSTLVAARLEGRKAIGIEIEERYCEIAAKRLQQEVLQIA